MVTYPPKNAFAGLLNEPANALTNRGVGQSKLEFEIGAETNLTLTLFQQAIQKGLHHADMSEVRATDVGVGTAPDRVVPHVFKF